jgi:FAD/FMN-containing dehydrogenase
MWEAFFAFHICIACFFFRILGNTWVSLRIPEHHKSLMLFDRLQVSVRIPSTTLGGMECHNSSGAQHRAYCGTNDCVVGGSAEAH